MARSRTLALLPTFLLLLLLAAGAHQPSDAAEVRGYQHDALATGVALFCAARLPTQPCCRTLVHSARSGGVGCLCRVASETALIDAALNATELLRLYARCAAAASLASSSFVCDAGAATAGVPERSSPCAPAALADQIGLFCGGIGEAAPPTAPCCETVAAAVGMGAGDAPCFCRAARASGAGVRGVVGLYNACGGLRTRLASKLVKSCARLPPKA